ncbi:hypothetical protein Zm00014a_039025 [Zea mays]|uniref:Uncharacterized protein n=1 Tax=Zea mays TaxID=4577 RepID=A0A3L6FF38_MAIZE|nr:hypothetical protein Zm00014a_039025 [Zea mays]
MVSLLSNQSHQLCRFFSKKHTGSDFGNYCRKKLNKKSLRYVTP